MKACSGHHSPQSHSPLKAWGGTCYLGIQLLTLQHSYPSTLKLCGSKLLNGNECLQLSPQSTIKFPKSFYNTLSLE